MPRHRVPLLHLLPHLAKLPQSIRMVHVGVTAHFHLLPHYLPSITLSDGLDHWLRVLVLAESV